MEAGTAAMADGLELMWVRDGRGRMERARTPEHRPAPWLVVGWPDDGSAPVWAASADLADDVVERVAVALPDGERAILAALGDHGEVELARASVLDGPPPAPDLPGDAVVRTSDDPDADAVLALLPSKDRDLAAPWAVVLVDGEPAAVCMAARILPGRAAAGVWTYERHRRRGLATAATAVWAAMVDGTPHYGHDVDNTASAGVARRVGFRPIGRWWSVRPPG